MKVAIFYNGMKDLSGRSALICELMSRGHEVIAVAPFDGSEEFLRQLGVTCIDICMTRRGMAPWREFRTIWQIYRISSSLKPDVVLNYTIKPIIYCGIGARLGGVRRIVSVVTGLGYMFVEGGRLPGLRRYLAATLYRVALRWNERVIFQNSDDMELFVGNGTVSKSRAFRVPGSGVDTDFFSPGSETFEEGHFLLISRMLWDKGVADFVGAAKRLKERYPNARFSLLGPVDDNPAAIPLETLKAWHARGAVEYLGSTDDVRPFLARCAVYVLPSYYREGIPRTNLEALAMGKPIITTAMPGCRETVEPNINGFLIPPRDEAALVEAMETFLKKPYLCREMGLRSRDMALRIFKKEEVDRKICAVLEGTVPQI